MAQAQLRTLADLKRLPALGGFYLAGGSAVAFHLGHRRSNDLDLFSLEPEADLEVVGDALARLRGYVAVASTDAVLKARVGSVALDVVRYPYGPLKRPRTGPAGFPVAGLLDLAAMKLAAIATRGIHRDFWDLYAILKGSRVTLDAALDAYVARFGVKRADLYHVLRALTYFDDAAKDRLPRGLTKTNWRQIQAYFTGAATRAMRKRT